MPVEESCHSSRSHGELGGKVAGLSGIRGNVEELDLEPLFVGPNQLPLVVDDAVSACGVAESAAPPAVTYGAQGKRSGYGGGALRGSL